MYEGVKSLGTGVADRYDLRHGCWELNLSLAEQSVSLTIKPSLQPLRLCSLLFLTEGDVGKALRTFLDKESLKGSFHLRLCYLDRTGSPLWHDAVLDSF